MLVEKYLANVIALAEQALDGIAKTFKQANQIRHLFPNPSMLMEHSMALSNSWPDGSQTQEDVETKLIVAGQLLNTCLNDSQNPEKICFGILNDGMGYLCLGVREDASVEAVRHTLKGVVERLFQLKNAYSYREEWIHSPERQRYENPKLNDPLYCGLLKFHYADTERNEEIGYDEHSKVVWCQGRALESLQIGAIHAENPYRTLARMLRMVREPASDQRQRRAELKEATQFITNALQDFPLCSLLVDELKTRIALLQSSLFDANIDDLLAQLKNRTVSVEQFHLELRELRVQSQVIRAIHHSLIQSDLTGLELPLFKEYVHQYLHCVSEGFATLEMDDIKELPMTCDAVVKLREAKYAIPDNVDRIMGQITVFMRRVSQSEKSQMVLMVFELCQHYQLNLFHIKMWPEICKPLCSMSMFEPEFVRLCDEHPETVLRAYTRVTGQIRMSLDIAQKALFRIYRKFSTSQALPVDALVSLATHLLQHYHFFEKKDSYMEEVEKSLRALINGLHPKLPKPPSTQDVYNEIKEILAVPARNPQLRVAQVNSAKNVLSKIIKAYSSDHPDMHRIGMLIAWFEFKDSMLMFDELLLKTEIINLSHAEFQNDLRLIQDHCPEFTPNTMLTTLNPLSFDFNTFERYIEMHMTVASLRLKHFHPQILEKIPPLRESVIFLRECLDGHPKHILFIMKMTASYLKKLPEDEQASITLLMFRQSRKHRVSIWNSVYTKAILEPLTKMNIHSTLFKDACDEHPSQLLCAYSEIATASSRQSLSVAHAALTRIVAQRYEGNNFNILISTFECLSFARKLLAEYRRIKNPDSFIANQQFSLGKLIRTLTERADLEEQLRARTLEKPQYN